MKKKIGLFLLAVLLLLMTGCSNARVRTLNNAETVLSYVGEGADGLHQYESRDGTFSWKNHVISLNGEAFAVAHGRSFAITFADGRTMTAVADGSGALASVTVLPGTVLSEADYDPMAAAVLVEYVETTVRGHRTLALVITALILLALAALGIFATGWVVGKLKLNQPEKVIRIARWIGIGLAILGILMVILCFL